MIKKISTLIFLISLISLTSCFSVKPPKDYQLTAINEQIHATKPSQETILVSIPQAASSAQGKSMLYLSQDYSMSAFVKNEWNDPPAQMLQTLLIKSLQNTGYFHAVILSPSPARANLRLDTTLNKLQQNFTQKPSVLEMSMDVVLMDNRSFRVLASHHFSTNVPASEDTPYGGVVAANQACQQLMTEISSWIVKEAKGYRN